jgi:hypothetical protein
MLQGDTLCAFDARPSTREGRAMRRDVVLAIVIPLIAVVLTVALIVGIGESLLFLNETVGPNGSILLAVTLMALITLVAILLSRGGGESAQRH